MDEKTEQRSELERKPMSLLIVRLAGCKNFIVKRTDEFIINAFVNMSHCTDLMIGVI